MQKLINKAKSTLRKKKGDDKLVVTLVLIALGVGLCIIYRNNIYSTMTTALNSLSSNMTNLMNGVVSK